MLLSKECCCRSSSQRLQATVVSHRILKRLLLPAAGPTLCNHRGSCYDYEHALSSTLLQVCNMQPAVASKPCAANDGSVRGHQLDRDKPRQQLWQGYWRLILDASISICVIGRAQYRYGGLQQDKIWRDEIEDSNFRIKARAQRHWLMALVRIGPCLEVSRLPFRSTGSFRPYSL